MLLKRLGLVYSRQRFSPEVEPINAPWMRRITAIRRFYILRKNKKVIWPYVVMLITDLVAAVAINTVKQKIFGKAFFPVSIMVFCFWIIPDRANMKIFKHLVALHSRFQDRFRNFYTLPASAI